MRVGHHLEQRLWFCDHPHQLDRYLGQQRGGALADEVVVLGETTRMGTARTLVLGTVGCDVSGATRTSTRPDVDAGPLLGPGMRWTPHRCALDTGPVVVSRSAVRSAAEGIVRAVGQDPAFCRTSHLRVVVDGEVLFDRHLRQGRSRLTSSRSPSPCSRPWSAWLSPTVA